MTRSGWQCSWFQQERSANRAANRPVRHQGAKKAAEEHYLRCEKQPDSNLGVPQASIAAGAYGVGNFHLFMRAKPVRAWDALWSVRSPRSARFAWCNLFRDAARCIRKGHDKPPAP